MEKALAALGIELSCLEGSPPTLSLQRGKAADLCKRFLEANVPGISVADFSWNNFGDKGMAVLAPALASNTTITKLLLDWNDLGEQGMVRLCSGLATNPTLVSLSLKGNAIGDGGVRGLVSVVESPTSVLHSINLSGNSIRDGGLTAIGTMLASPHCRLRQINLSFNSVGEAGARGLATGLAANRTLTALDVRGDVGRSAASILAHAICANPVLTEVDLWSSALSDADAKAVVDALLANAQRMAAQQHEAEQEKAKEGVEANLETERARWRSEDENAAPQEASEGPRPKRTGILSLLNSKDNKARARVVPRD